MRSDPWAKPYGSNEEMPMTLHNYKFKQFHRTLTEKIHPAVSEICIPAHGKVHMGPLGNHGQAHLGQMGKSP